MKTKNIRGRRVIPVLLIALALSCFALSSTVQAGQAGGPPIVGLWHVYFTSDFGPPFESYKQWHSDGLEIESPNFSLGQCMGTWKQTAHRGVQLFHVGWTVGGGPNGSVRFEETELNTVSTDRNSYDGTYDQKFFDSDGNVVFEDTGTIHATRLSVD